MTAAATADHSVGTAPPAATEASDATLEPPLSGLSRGRFATGFHASWEFDAARPYDMKFADGSHYAEAGAPAPRPLLMNVWYPAARPEGAAPMPYQGYLDFASAGATKGNAGLARFAAALADYDRDVIANEVFGAKKLAELDPAARAAFDAFLAAPTAAFRDAPPAGGRFPLVLVHSGYGSSPDDQSFLCEWLASCGFVVVGSAYERADGKSFNIDAHAGSLADFAFLIGRARARPDVDAARIAAVGHSGGAHTVLRWRVSESCPAQAIVSLDTTQDYYSVRDFRWSDLIDPVRTHPDRATGSLLVCASPHAHFELFEPLEGADRWYFTAPLDHDEFISHGIERLDQAPEHPELAPRTRLCHVALLSCVKAFLDANLYGDRAALEKLSQDLAPFPQDGAAPHLEHEPPGEVGPPDYDLAAQETPTPRQLRPLLEAAGLEKTLAVLRGAHDRAPKHPIFAPALAFGWTFELVADDRLDEARALHDLYRELVPDYQPFWFGMANFFEGYEPDFGLACWQGLVKLEPANAAARDRLQKCEAAHKK